MEQILLILYLIKHRPKIHVGLTAWDVCSGRRLYTSTRSKARQTLTRMWNVQRWTLRHAVASRDGSLHEPQPIILKFNGRGFHVGNKKDYIELSRGGWHGPLVNLILTVPHLSWSLYRSLYNPLYGIQTITHMFHSGMNIS